MLYIARTCALEGCPNPSTVQPVFEVPCRPKNAQHVEYADVSYPSLTVCEEHMETKPEEYLGASKLVLLYKLVDNPARKRPIRLRHETLALDVEGAPAS